MYLLQPDIVHLDAETISVYVQAATKIFGHYASEMSERWSDDDLPHLKAVVDTILESLTRFTASPYIEVQERVRHRSVVGLHH